LHDRRRHPPRLRGRSVDAKNPCGSYGWAIEGHLGKAENKSLRRCYQYGGRDCVVRAWACDEKG
jgi:hypothetical protein